MICSMGLVIETSKGGEIQLDWGDGGREGLSKPTFKLSPKECGADYAKNVQIAG